MPLAFSADETAEWKRLGSLLTAANYTTRTIGDLIGLSDSPDMILSNSARYSLLYMGRLSRIEDPAAILACLFLFSGRVAAANMQILDPALLAALQRHKLVVPVESEPEFVRGRVCITELNGRYFLSDFLFENLGYDFQVSYREDSCMPPHASSIQLLKVLHRPENASSFLDVGCGSGCQSILFASDYDLVEGFDPSARSVAFARVNAMLNGSHARYTVDRWETFNPRARYEHIAFNAPDVAAFSFINSGLRSILAKNGCAQIILVCEITEAQGNLDAVIEKRIENPKEWQIDTDVHVDSPFSLAREHVASRMLPRGSLLIDEPSRRSSFFEDLVERRVIEIVHLTLNVRRRNAL